MFKERLEYYTEQEMLDYLNEFFDDSRELNGKALNDHLSKLVHHLIKITHHPEGSDLIFYPPDEREDSPEGVLEEIKRWRKSQGLPLFKDSE
ncbi:bacteriocin immunity protein [Pseudocitrobacter cyperus]|uniref:Bacteriocin immunity protein n=1 Tax=Pseudocitrobacter cyperus TaxID=3112843 RepID=A0ABV0HGU8_9ENTR